MNSLDLVLPCFNEESTLPSFFVQFERLRDRLGANYKVNLIIVDNGSSDTTYQIAESYIQKQIAQSSGKSKFTLLKLSRNFGKEASLSAGLMRSTSDICVPLDADLQDPMEAVELLIQKWESTGANVVLGVRKYHANHSKYRIFLSKFYVSLFNKLSDIPLESSVGEFRLMDSDVISAFRSMGESQRFVRGLFAWLGFREERIEYERVSREFGGSKFNSRKLFLLGMEGISSFSIAPLRLSFILGITISILSFLYGLTITVLALFGVLNVPGYASILVSILFLGGLQLLCIGILGEYLGKTLLEAKQRPLYFIAKELVING